MWSCNGDVFIADYHGYEFKMLKMSKKNKIYRITVVKDNKRIYATGKSYNYIENKNSSKRLDQIFEKLVNLVKRYELLLNILQQLSFKPFGKNGWKRKFDHNKNLNCSITIRIPCNSRKKEGIHDHLNKIFMFVELKNEIYFQKKHQIPIYLDDFVDFDIEKIFKRYEATIIKKGGL